MYLKRDGNVLISTVLILSLIIIISDCSFKMMRNNNNIKNLYCTEGDVYNIKENETKILINFMKQLNEEKTEDLLLQNFKMNYLGNELLYDKEKDKFYLYLDNELKVERTLEYSIKNQKIILIPTYKTKYIISNNIYLGTIKNIRTYI